MPYGRVSVATGTMEGCTSVVHSHSSRLLPSRPRAPDIKLTACVEMYSWTASNTISTVLKLTRAVCCRTFRGKFNTHEVQAFRHYRKYSHTEHDTTQVLRCNYVGHMHIDRGTYQYITQYRNIDTRQHYINTRLKAVNKTACRHLPSITIVSIKVLDISHCSVFCLKREVQESGLCLLFRWDLLSRRQRLTDWLTD
jgi:hypothetical protein